MTRRLLFRKLLAMKPKSSTFEDAWADWATVRNRMGRDRVDAREPELWRRVERHFSRIRGKVRRMYGRY